MKSLLLEMDLMAVKMLSYLRLSVGLLDERGHSFLSISEILFGIMGPFSVPQEIADRSIIVLLIRRAL